MRMDYSNLKTSMKSSLTTNLCEQKAMSKKAITYRDTKK
ncbi:hypothetical protein FLAT13_02599 [Flavobacterium salmonis]|uniref:Uncharacterized protein n=1 Tax=Flavobacterium salmonis TaxID=2654844 RepID=A0A6V6Z094_9FLAO|nr:hypothetical protein FLAT13_02599 [Flavobacterium salmonis]